MSGEAACCLAGKMEEKPEEEKADNVDAEERNRADGGEMPASVYILRYLFACEQVHNSTTKKQQQRERQRDNQRKQKQKKKREEKTSVFSSATRDFKSNNRKTTTTTKTQRNEPCWRVFCCMICCDEICGGEDTASCTAGSTRADGGDVSAKGADANATDKVSSWMEDSLAADCDSSCL